MFVKVRVCVFVFVFVCVCVAGVSSTSFPKPISCTHKFRDRDQHLYLSLSFPLSLFSFCHGPQHSPLRMHSAHGVRGCGDVHVGLGCVVNVGGLGDRPRGDLHMGLSGRLAGNPHDVPPRTLKAHTQRVQPVA
jgi:hypothetical protein